MQPKQALLTGKYIITAFMIVLLSILIFVKFAHDLQENQLERFDRTYIDWIQSHINPELTVWMKGITLFGAFQTFFVLLPVSVSLMVWRKKKWEAVFFAAAVLGGALFNQLLKHIFERQRPMFHRIVEETGYSFPSGHSMASIVFYGMLAMLLLMFVKSPVLKLLIAVMAGCLVIMIGVSRIYLGVHYPSDVAAGFAAGAAWLTVCRVGLQAVLVSRRS
ncbi:phosphatase PAP2 family protein [Paenibacillus sp. MZ04-78.2]|uniref:phosphatase PAP2 family protein n=1 Tax=Paenibacillus sp. MZ04-78.2 TaxID=2962034 RepID=UPI0020B87C48|nr:phosphatase PAP2 family protein [Paenibacillus sp. MZ04-78.2]MCP3772039.1 phosphatase PAP2 family protein [Paenibacillus sp. MZ04-78.2]